MQRQGRIGASLLVPRPDEAAEEGVEDAPEGLDEATERPQELFGVRLLRGRAPPEYEGLLRGDPGFALAAEEERRIVLEQSLKPFKRAFADFQRLDQSSTSPFIASGT